jgi:hypothetical protein
MLDTKTTIMGDEIPTNVCTGRTFQVTVVGKGPCSATVTLEYSNDRLAWFPVPDSPKTVTSVGGAGTDTIGSEKFALFNEGWGFMRAACTAITGTDARCVMTLSIV